MGWVLYYLCCHLIVSEVVLSGLLAFGFTNWVLSGLLAFALANGVFFQVHLSGAWAYLIILCFYQ